MTKESKTDKIEKLIMELSDTPDEERKHNNIIATGKFGIIMFVKQMYTKLGLSEEEIELLVESFKKNLPEGSYVIDENGKVTYSQPFK